MPRQELQNKNKKRGQKQENTIKFETVSANFIETFHLQYKISSSVSGEPIPI